MPKLTKRLIDNLNGDHGDRVEWDTELRGFGVRVTPKGVKSFVIQYRNTSGRSRRQTIGQFGTWTVDEARTEARALLVAVDKGIDPAEEKRTKRVAPTIADLMRRYISDHVVPHNATSTADQVRDIVDKRILPSLGNRKVSDVGRDDIEQLHRQMMGTPRLANLSLSILSKAFNLSEGWKLRPQNSNPCRGIKRFKENARERFLSPDEITRLGAVLDEAETVGIPWRIDPDKPAAKHARKDNPRTLVDPMAVAVLRVLLFSGARLSEILELEWRHVDATAGTLALPKVKGGPRQAHPAGEVTMGLIGAMDAVENSPWVFPRRNDPTRHISPEVVENAWQRIRWHAGFPDVRIHDLRHTVGTLASASGANAFVIRDLLRHRGVAMTSRYVNKAAGPVRDMADVVGKRISEGLQGSAGDRRSADEGDEA